MAEIFCDHCISRVRKTLSDAADEGQPGWSVRRFFEGELMEWSSDEGGILGIHRALKLADIVDRPHIRKNVFKIIRYCNDPVHAEAALKMIGEVLHGVDALNDPKGFDVLLGRFIHSGRRDIPLVGGGTSGGGSAFGTSSAWGTLNHFEAAKAVGPRRVAQAEVSLGDTGNSVDLTIKSGDGWAVRDALGMDPSIRTQPIDCVEAKALTRDNDTANVLNKRRQVEAIIDIRGPDGVLFYVNATEIDDIDIDTVGRAVARYLEAPGTGPTPGMNGLLSGAPAGTLRALNDPANRALREAFKKYFFYASPTWHGMGQDRLRLFGEVM